jgi:alpha-beta hydrolase superfamily lysophospholipase
MKAVTKMSALCNHEQAQALLINDPISGGNAVPFSFLASLFSYRPAVEPQDFDHCPILLTQPDDDRWTPLLSSSRFFDDLACPKSLVMLEDAGHYPMEVAGLKTLHKAMDDFLKAVSL